MGEPSGITAAQPDLLQPEGQHRIVGGVGQHDEAVVGQLLGRGQELDRVGQQRAVVADHLELDPVGAEGLPGQLGRQHGLAGRGAAGSVGQHPDAELVEQVEQRPPPRRIDPAHGHGGQAVPDSTSAWRRARRLVIPPVPSSRRDGSVSPAMHSRQSADGGGRSIIDPTIPPAPGADRSGPRRPSLSWPVPDHPTPPDRPDHRRL